MQQAGNDGDAAFYSKVLTQSGKALLVLFGVYLVVGEIHAARGKQAEERLDVSVKLLESKDIQARLNGIYSLERIAKNSRKDHWPIMEILTAYVRAKAPCIRFPGGKNECLTIKNPIPEQPADLQAIFYVIGRRKTEFERQENHRFINLSNADLRGAFLARAPLINAFFSGSNLEEAELYAANLSGAVFTGWNQGGLSLPAAVVDHADFRSAVLDGTRFEGVDLSEAKNIPPDRLERACLSAETIFPLKREYEYLTEYIKTDEYRRMHKRVCLKDDALVLSPMDIEQKPSGFVNPGGAISPHPNASRHKRKSGNTFTPSPDTTTGNTQKPGGLRRRYTPNLDGTTRR
jgi:hypothetical protein